MPSKVSLCSLSVLLASFADAQFGLTTRPEGAFEATQPANTTILGQYGHSEPVYPSPKIKGTGGWADALEKARAFVAELTLEEKSLMVTGQPGPCIGNIYPIPRLNFSGLCLQDGPASLRTADFVSVFPSGVTLASSFDRQIIYDKHLAQGREFRAKGAHVALAPVAGPLGRSVYGGRNWEGFSPDPYLTGIGMEESIRGFQDAGVQATAKHYILNEQETLRNPVSVNGSLVYNAVSSNVDDRTVHELYLWPFANAVKANAAAFMCNYNRINGSYGCQNSKSLNGWLKTELGFQGYVMSDWFAVHSGVASIEAGLDMDMPGNTIAYRLIEDENMYESYFGGNVTIGVNNGTIDTDRLDDMVARIMTPYYYLHQDEDFPSTDPSSALLNSMGGPSSWLREWNLTGQASRDVRDNHGELIRKWAAESTILLKNERQALPLKAPRTIAVYGNDAGEPLLGPLNQEDFEFGTLAIGGGSGAGRFSYVVTPLDALKARAARDHSAIAAWQNNTAIIEAANASSASTGPGLGSGNFPYTPDVCLVFTKNWIAEAVDRNSLDLEWEADELVTAVASSCNNTVVITHSPGVNIIPFADNPNVTAILLAHYPGQETGNSIVDVLYGDVNPSAKLPYTVAYNASDYLAGITLNVTTDGLDDWQAWFDEKLEIDYRYFDAHEIDVRYEFGFGLSYTTFDMSGLVINKADPAASISGAPTEQETQPGGNPDLWKTLYQAEVTLRNTGDIKGKAVAQLYVSFPEASTPSGTPPRQLRGFDKIELAPGQRGTAKFDLHRRDISYWDSVQQQWIIPAGEFTLSAGFSSRDLVEIVTFTPVGGNSTARV